ncbi:MAG: TraB/GumN family protein [Bacteroidales bacterium]|nr:TraB/GumN family protein [Bacteroidales bacterium]
MKTLLAITILLYSHFIWAQDTVKYENALLWEITGNDIEEPSYIFGTIHLIPADDYFFTDIMKEKFENCKILALEIDINMSLLEQVSLAKKLILPDNKSLSDYMTEGEYKKFSDYVLDSLKIKQSKWNQIIKIKPLFSIPIILNELLPKTKTYETELNKIAKKKKMDIIGLETADYQIDVLNSISIEKQVEMITADEPEEDMLKEYLKMVSVYKEQNINEMLEMYKEDETMLEFEDELLIQRNSNWIPVIEKQIKKGSTFIAVGAMHLPGMKGVLNLLMLQGYSVSPVKIN